MAVLRWRPGGSKYSPLNQINRRNVHQLRPVWIFDAGDWSDGTVLASKSAFESTPLMVDGVVYVTTPFHRLFALDAETGQIRWQFDPQFDRSSRVNLYVSRGLAYRTDGQQKRLLLGDQQGRLFSINAVTGRPDPAFGRNGVIQLREGVADRYPQTPYGLTSPVCVCGDIVIAGAWVADGEPQGPAGDIRGFDIRTGRLRWTFHTVPRPGEFGHDTWAGDSWRDRTGVNGWSVFAADPARQLVFVPLTSPATDFYGGDRHGANLFGDSLVALDLPNRQTPLALPDRPSQSRGLRPACAARSVPMARAAPPRGRSRADHQNRFRVPLRPVHRTAAVSDRRAPHSEKPHSGRTDLAHATRTAKAPALRPPIHAP